LALRVLGIDPGTRSIGHGLVVVESGHCRALKYGTIRVNTRCSFPERLRQIHQAIVELIDETQPDAVAVEEVFVSQNAKTALKLGHARGVILLAAMEKQVEVAEYAPREIKQAVSGRGGASKAQVQGMITQILKLRDLSLQEDAADGLAVALCHGLRNSQKN
jgi:crossover junction endodeoxyribonuclease RuvC